MFILLIASLLVILSLFLFVKLDNYRKKFNHLLQAFPNPKNLKYYPILGNIFIDRRRGKLLEAIKNWSKDNKSFCLRFPLFGLFIIHINNAEDAEVVLTSNTNLKKSRAYDFLQDWLGTGLLTSTGTKWYNRRKMLTPAFHFSILRQFVETIIDNSERLVRKLEKECEKSQTDIKPIISNSALNTICETSMGTKLDAESKDDVNKEYVKAVYEMSEMITYRFARPWMHINSLFQLFFGKKFNSVLKILHNFTSNVIIERENNINMDETKGEIIEEEFLSKKKFALLDLLLKEKSKNNIDFEGVREEVDTFMFEGHDTVSSSIMFTLHKLAYHPEIQDKIVDELKKIFEDGRRRTTYKDLQCMNYLEMCIKESLRLYPSVIAFAREITGDLTIRNVKIPKGAFCMIHTYCMHRDPKYFPDPEKFDPERFSKENSTGRHPFAYIPFSAGPRNCIGQKFAMLELKSVFSEILWNYVIEPVHNAENLMFYIDLILRNDGPVFIKFRRRKHDL